ncbi:hypothetical protein PN499_09875 [Kamptonema animale CS-326]|nr:hypothetical protein [Kamptonema animale]MDB9511488.1 hypothetical protein [Kamptonema animale CS-326]
MLPNPNFTTKGATGTVRFLPLGERDRTTNISRLATLVIIRQKQS